MQISRRSCRYWNRGQYRAVAKGCTKGLNCRMNCRWYKRHSHHRPRKEYTRRNMVKVFLDGRVVYLPVVRTEKAV